MHDLDKIIMTAALTIFGSASVLIFGQIIIKFIIEPIQDLKKLLGEIQYALSFHARPITTSIGKEEFEIEAQKILRHLSCDLNAKIDLIPLYPCWSQVFCRGFLPPKKKTIEASKWLMSLSNAVRSDVRSKNLDIVDKIYLLLNLTTPDKT